MTTEEIKQKVIDYANGYGIFPEIALAQIQRESAFNPLAVGADGEHGLGQFMPGTWARFGQGRSFDVDAFDVDYNLTAWGEYMTWLLTRYGGDYTKALQGYNGGEGHVDQGNVSQAAQTYAKAVIDAAAILFVDPVLNPGANPPPLGATDWKTIGIAIAVVAGLMFAFRR